MPVDLPTLIEALSRPAAYSHPVDDFELHQTHISVVFLAGEFAYKIKKPVSLGFLDFSDLARRKFYCDEEVRLNRRLAPDVYLGTVPITRQENPAPTYRFGGSGEVVEWAVQMRRLPGDATLEHKLVRGEVAPDLLAQLARRLARFHANADRSDRISSFACLAAVKDNSSDNFRQTMPHIGHSVHGDVHERIRKLTDARLTELADRIELRAQRHVPCDTHGDLRLDHFYVFSDVAPPGDLVIIDCIEFSDRYRFADPIADITFLAMDFIHQGRADLASVFTNAYIEASHDHEGASLLPYYISYRAIVRAKVEAIRSVESEVEPAQRLAALQRARSHWLLALGQLEHARARPALVVVGGLPGTGKSTLSKAIADAGNFVVLRSDVVRKEIASEFAGELYDRASSERTYGELLRRAVDLIWRGQRVIIDANFRDDHWRVQFHQSARGWCVPMVFFHCRADRKVIQGRLEQRNDVSDADWSTYLRLESEWQPASETIRAVTCEIDTSDSLERSLQAAVDHLTHRGLLAPTTERQA